MTLKYHVYVEKHSAFPELVKFNINDFQVDVFTTIKTSIVHSHVQLQLSSFPNLTRSICICYNNPDSSKVSFKPISQVFV